MTKQSFKVDLSPKNNFIFKKIFTSPGNESILIDFLSAILKENIVQVELIQGESENLGNYIDSRTFRFDIKVTLADGRIIDVEMQKEDSSPIEKRLTGYAGRIVSEQLKIGDNYEDIKETIVICILNYNFIDLPEYHTETITVAKQNREYELSNYIKYHFIELPKFRKCEPDLNNKLDQWLLFLDNLNKELIEMATYKNEEIKKAKEIHETLKANKNIRQIIDDIEWAEIERNSQLSYMRKKGYKEGHENGHKEGHKKGHEEGLEQGIKQGIKQGITEGIKEGVKKGSTEEKERITKKLLGMEIPIEQICELTELSKEEIEQIKKDLK